MAMDSVFPLLVAAALLSRTAPRGVRATSVGDNPAAPATPAVPVDNAHPPGRPAWLEYPGAATEAQWDPGPDPNTDVGELAEAVELTAASDATDVRLCAGDPDATQQPAADAADTARTSQQGGAADTDPRTKDTDDQQQIEQRSGPVAADAEDVAEDVPEDAEAMPSEVLPMPAPLSMGRGPPMTLSLEDMDYLTILRPPQAPPSRAAAGSKGGSARKGAAAAKNKRKVNSSTKGNGNKASKQPSPGKAPGKAPGKSRPKASPPRPPQPPQPPQPPPSSYSPSYDAPHPYGYGYGAYDYPRYQDPVMTHEYQQAASYPEEERFRPLMGRPLGPPMMGAPMGRPPPPMGTPLAPSGPQPPPPASAPATASGYDPYMGYRHRDFPLQDQRDQRDQRPSGSGAVQVTQSMSAGEHHSSHDAAAWLSSLPPSTAASTLSTAPTAVPSPDLTTATASAARKATLKDILLQDCPGAEELGYCDSPPRYPIQQVVEAIQRCSELMDHMYAPTPDPEDPDSVGESEGACQSVRRVLRPGYVRDATSGRWLVALQSRGDGAGAAPAGADRGARVVQRVPVERCSGPGRPCARLADTKCARNLGFRNGARSTACEQRTALVALLTWDPEAPADCPRTRMARFPVACVCKMV